MLVSIIVPCYNQAQYLPEALESIWKQKYENWECIIVNDGSNDNTGEIAKLWQKKNGRFKYIYKENGGLSSARNLGLNNATGDYIQFLDSDDILSEDKLERSIDILKNNISKDGNIVITNFRMFFDNPLKPKNPFCHLSPELFNFNKVLLEWETLFSIPIHCGLFDVKLFNDFKFPEELRAKEDWVMWLFIFQKNYNVYFLDQPMAFYRLNPSGMTANAKHMEENHIKAIAYIENIISKKDYIEYLISELNKKYIENTKLKTTINNYQKSKSYKWIKKVNDIFLIKLFFKTLKKTK
ncbi:MAG: glycosyltransferase [Flavobacteriaceae bacterium]|nr:glycosyltransferase [Flavobacteriaceae bacterium]